MNSGQSCPVTKLEKILVASDRSLFSEGAITAAITFAKQCSSKLYVMTVVETNPEYGTAGAEFLQKEKEEAVQYLASLKAQTLKDVPSRETIFRYGDSASRLIIEEATQKKVDMITVGRRGRSGLEKVLLGSAAAKVIGHAPCKVLIVPKAAGVEFKKVLIATDGSEHARAAADEAIEIAKRCGCRLIAASVATSEDDMERARAYAGEVVLEARKTGIDAETIVLVGKPHELIAGTAKTGASI